ncbi:MAG: CopG family transcriptional regulator [Chloroflexota bacterium]
MRTTVTLDPDLAARLREVARQRGISFKAAINAAVRAGLATSVEPQRPYREKGRPLGVRPGIDLTKALRIAAALEDDATTVELALRK